MVQAATSECWDRSAGYMRRWNRPVLRVSGSYGRPMSGRLGYLRPLRRNRGGYTYDGPDEPVATYRCRWALVPLRTPCGTVGPARDACLRPAGPRRGRVSCTDLVASCCVRPTWRLHVYGGPDEPDATDRCRWVLSRLRTSYEAVDPARVTCLRLARPSNVRSLIAAINGSKNA